MNNKLKINFAHNQLIDAAYFIEYCADHNVECSTLNNDGCRYSIEVSYSELANLNRYLVVDAAKYVQQMSFLALINESLLAALSSSIQIAEHLTC